MSDLISRQDAIDALKKIMFTHLFECGEYIGEDTREFSIMNAEKALDVIENLPSAEPEQSRKFLEIVVEYPGFCTYPEYKGKPYYAIKFEENGETIVGFGTYKPEVLSQYLREYFISSAEPERKKGKWVDGMPYVNSHWRVCSVCHETAPNSAGGYNFCPNCGADMRGDHE